MCYFTHCVILHTVCNFTHKVALRCFFVARRVLSWNYALSSVKFLGPKLRLCKKSDKYQVCVYIPCNTSLCTLYQCTYIVIKCTPKPTNQYNTRLTTSNLLWPAWWKLYTSLIVPLCKLCKFKCASNVLPMCNFRCATCASSNVQPVQLPMCNLCNFQCATCATSNVQLPLCNVCKFKCATCVHIYLACFCTHPCLCLFNEANALGVCTVQALQCTYVLCNLHAWKMHCYVCPLHAWQVTTGTVLHIRLR